MHNSKASIIIKKIYSIKFSLAALACVSSLCACAPQEQGVVLMETFESQMPTFVKNATITSDKDKVRSGKKSLFVDLSKADKNAEIINFKFDKNNLVEISFKYKILENSDNARLRIKSSFDKNGRDIYTTNITVPQKFVEYRGLFRVPADNPLKLSVSADKGIVAVLDDIKIKAASTDKNADWSIADEHGLKTLRHTPFAAPYAKFTDSYLNMSKEQFFPFIDKFGQFKHRQWPNKINDQIDFEKRKADEENFLKDNPPFEGRDKYFGLIDARYKFSATGRFRTQKVDGKWFLITPEGNLFWSMGANCAGANGDQTPLDTREHFFDDVSDSKYISKSYQHKFSYSKNREIKNFTFFRRNADLKYNGGDYSEILARRAASWGMNTYAGWSSKESIDSQKVPYTVYLTTAPQTLEKIDGKFKIKGWWMTPPDFFSPKFAKNAEASAKAQEKQLKSPLCIGAFFDNELPWQKEETLLAKGVISCVQTQPAKLAFRDILKNKYADISALNNAWGSKYKDWDDFMKEQDFFPSTPQGIADMIAFEKRFCERYFEVCRNAIKEIDKDALYLGCRFGGTTGRLVAPISSHYCDVITINVYKDGVSQLNCGENAEDKPILIGEFHFGDMGNGVFGGGLCPCPDEKTQVESFKKFVESALSNPAIIGTHWFKYADQPTTGRFDGENFAIGFVDICDTPHYALVKQMREISKDMYSMRLSVKTAKIGDDGTDKNYNP